jgi:hypothetical protein
VDVLETAGGAIDDEYERFVEGLPDSLRGVARHLPLRVGLTSRAGIGWCEAVDEPLVLALPSVVLAAIEGPAWPELVASAQRVHLFAMLGALVLAQADRGAVELDAELDELLGQFERHRHRAVAELRLLGAEQGSSFAAVERESRNAAADELAVFEGEGLVSVATCVAVHSRKRGLAFPATMAAAAASMAAAAARGAAAERELERLGHVHDFILGAMLGIGFRREVEELGERALAHRSWVLALARGRGQPAALGELLALAIDAFERAATAGDGLGAEALSAWAERRSQRVRELARVEVEAGRARLPERPPGQAA